MGTEWRFFPPATTWNGSHAASDPGTDSGSVHAADGRQVLEVPARPVGGEARIEVGMLAELASGTYYVRLETRHGVRTARLVLLR